MENLNKKKLEILKTKVQYTEASIKLSEILKKQKFDLATEYKIEKDTLKNKLNNFESDLTKKYDSLELNSTNVSTLFEISNLLLEFKYKDEEFLQKIDVKIGEILSKKEIATKNQDFILANESREEIKQFQDFLKAKRKNN